MARLKFQLLLFSYVCMYFFCFVVRGTEEGLLLTLNLLMTYQSQDQEFHAQEKNQKKTVTVNRITAKLILKTSFNSEQQLTQQQKIQKLNDLKSVHLQWLGIHKIQNLDAFCNIQILYLQNNSIRIIEGLQTLFNLNYLALNNNLIQSVGGLTHLKRIAGINLADNRILKLVPAEFPKSVQMLRLTGNPVQNYDREVVVQLPNLVNLDGDQIDMAYRFRIKGIAIPNSEYRAKYQSFLKNKVSQGGQESPQQVNLKQTRLQMQALTQSLIAGSQERHQREIEKAEEHFSKRSQAAKSLSRPLGVIKQQPQ